MLQRIVRVLLQERFLDLLSVYSQIGRLDFNETVIAFVCGLEYPLDIVVALRRTGHTDEVRYTRCSRGIGRHGEDA